MRKFIETRRFARLLRVATVLLVIDGLARIVFAHAPLYALMDASDNVVNGVVGLALAYATWCKSRDIDSQCDRSELR